MWSLSIQTGNDVYSFTLTGDVEGADNTVLGTTVGAVNNGQCVTDFVVIPNPTVVATGVAVGTDRFCGLGFVTVQSKFIRRIIDPISFSSLLSLVTISRSRLFYLYPSLSILFIFSAHNFKWYSLPSL